MEHHIDYDKLFWSFIWILLTVKPYHFKTDYIDFSPPDFWSVYSNPLIPLVWAERIRDAQRKAPWTGKFLWQEKQDLRELISEAISDGFYEIIAG